MAMLRKKQKYIDIHTEKIKNRKKDGDKIVDEDCGRTPVPAIFAPGSGFPPNPARKERDKTGFRNTNAQVFIKKRGLG